MGGQLLLQTIGLPGTENEQISYSNTRAGNLFSEENDFAAPQRGRLIKQPIAIQIRVQLFITANPVIQGKIFIKELRLALRFSTALK